MMRSRSIRYLLVSGLTSPGDADRAGTPRAIHTSYYAEHFRRLRETWRVRRYKPSVAWTSRITTALEL
jgi:hypothetical protein